MAEDSAGNLYGTTFSGGTGFGTVFKLTPDGTETWLYEFDSTDGSFPEAGLIAYKGNFYGTAFDGGPTDAGTIFKISPKGKATELYYFTSPGAGGNDPLAGVIADSKGNLYGTTSGGGDQMCECGNVFKLTRNGTEIPLHEFMGGNDGWGPVAGLIMDAAGNLYGTTHLGGGTGCGGDGCGTVFKLTLDGTETVLYAFKGGSDGANPWAALITDGTNFYGTTFHGGAADSGTVFKLSPKGKKFKETLLLAFNGDIGGANAYAGVIADGAGNLYGTTYYGGLNSFGTVFELSAKGKETVLYNFQNGNDGAYPYGGLIMDASGNLYGTASTGGSGGGGCYGGAGCGTVFKVSK